MPVYYEGIDPRLGSEPITMPSRHQENRHPGPMPLRTDDAAPLMARLENLEQRVSSLEYELRGRPAGREA